MRWLAEYAEDGDVAFRIGRDEDLVVAEWIGLARLTSRRDGSGAELVAEPGADPGDVEKIRRGSSRLLLRHLRGELALHGAAVEIGGRAAIFLGRSGEGKSTLAAKACARASATLLADDAIALDREGGAWLIAPLEENHWLDEPARRALGLPTIEQGKAPVRAARTGDRRVPLAVIIELAYGDAGAPSLVTTDGPLAAMAAIVPQVVRFVLDEPAVQRRELETLAELVAKIPILRLERPRGYDALDGAVDLVARRMRSGGTT